MTMTTTTITYNPNDYRTPAVHASLAKRTPYIPLLPAQPKLRIIPSLGRDGWAAGHDNLEHTAIKLGAEAGHVSVVYLKLIHQSKWPMLCGEEMNRSVMMCSTRCLCVKSMILSHWCPERNIVRMYTVGIVWTIMCRPCGPVAIVIALHAWDEGRGLRIVVVPIVGWGEMQKSWQMYT
jgi:hypothetical protein